jgi:hypothetical protein
VRYGDPDFEAAAAARAEQFHSAHVSPSEDGMVDETGRP